jgi:hypothetical protein
LAAWAAHPIHPDATHGRRPSANPAGSITTRENREIIMFDASLTNADFISAAMRQDWQTVDKCYAAVTAHRAIDRRIPLVDLPVALHQKYHEIEAQLAAPGFDPEAYLEEEHPAMPMHRYVMLVSKITKITGRECQSDYGDLTWEWQPKAAETDTRVRAMVTLTRHGIIMSDWVPDKMVYALIGVAAVHRVGWWSELHISLIDAAEEENDAEAEAEANSDDTPD